jgi:3',5'-cyclic AMP phosphodiesterase CpdA
VARRLAHLSDLHFGRTRPELLEPLVAAVTAARPDVVAISGDLTQRARDWQFREARAFVDRLGVPCVIVPGNHDVPLDRPIRRLFDPWGAYRRWFGPDLEPAFRDAEMIVLGMNTADPLSWQRGRIRGRALQRVRAAFAEAGPGVARIVVAHHPFEHQPDERKALMHGAREALDALAACGADIVLSGHLHAWRAEPFAVREGRAGVIQVHAGTGLSTRLRGEENDFNLLTLAPGVVTVERHAAREDDLRFLPVATARFRSGHAGWSAAPAADAATLPRSGQGPKSGRW